MLDKFNQHLYRHRGAKVFIVERLSELECETLFNMGSLKTLDDGYYSIINEQSTTSGFAYVFPLERAKIKTVSWTPPSTIISVNGKEFDAPSLIGQTLYEGDLIRAKYKTNSDDLFALTAVVTVPVTPHRL